MTRFLPEIVIIKISKNRHRSWNESVRRNWAGTMTMIKIKGSWKLSEILRRVFKIGKAANFIVVSYRWQEHIWFDEQRLHKHFLFLYVLKLQNKFLTRWDSRFYYLQSFLVAHFFLWFITELFFENDFPHSQENGFISEWVFLWSSSESLRENALPHLKMFHF